MNFQNIKDPRHYLECLLAEAEHNLFLKRHSRKWAKVKTECQAELAKLP